MVDMRKIFFPIRVKLMVIISSVVFLSLGLLSWISLDIFSRDIKMMVHTLNQRTSKLLLARLETEIENRISLLRLAAAFYADGQTNQLREILSKTGNDLYAVAFGESHLDLIVFSNSARLKADSMSTEDMNKIYSSSASLMRRAAAGELIIRNVSQIVEKPVYLIAFSMEGGKITAGLFSLSPLAAIVSETSGKAAPGAKPLYNSFVVDSEGKILLHAVADELISKADFSNHPAVKHMFSQKARTGTSPPYTVDNTRELATFARMELGGLGIISAMDEKKALEGVRIVRERSILISLLIISVALVFVWFFSRSISGPVSDLVEASLKIKEGKYDTKVDVQTRDEIEILGNSFNEMAEGLKEREALKGAFDKFVNPAVAASILQGDPLALGGTERNVTIFFSDIRSFTAMSEKMKPQEVVQMLNAYFTDMVDIVHDTGGIVDKFIGDAIMAVWGTLKESKSDASNAVDAAVRMRRALRDFNTRHRGKFPKIRIGCGLNSGPVLSGQIGSKNRLECTVNGNAVNLASRLEKLNKTFGTDIIISESTYLQVKDEFACVSLQKIQIRGKAKRQQIYAVLGRLNDPTRPKTLDELRKILGTKDLSKVNKES